MPVPLTSDRRGFQRLRTLSLIWMLHVIVIVNRVELVNHEMVFSGTIFDESQNMGYMNHWVKMETKKRGVNGVQNPGFEKNLQRV